MRSALWGQSVAYATGLGNYSARRMSDRHQLTADNLWRLSRLS
jgi:hypothetical protein